MKEKEMKKKKFRDKIAYAYIRKIKKWMFCPVCQKGKMTIDKKSTVWTCEDCGYKLSADEFEDNCVFWFCDECQTYLNNQDGFDRNAVKHICRNCGYENDTTFENVKGICSDCGKIIPDPDATLCADCRQRRREKAEEWLITAGKVVGVAAAMVGAVCVAAAAAGDERGGNADYAPLDDGDDTDLRTKYSSDWLKSASLEELQTERAKVQADYRNPELDIDYRGDLWDLLHEFDVAIGERQWNGEEPKGPAFHREHGWYLPNDDD
ncbi:MAG: hypothetical protein IKD02_04595 [Clostridia bacterium]|nr:hypothetical protein [Clostridia bacterium]